MSFFNKPAAPAWLIVGLGNPGAQYRMNRHNAGFLALDALANDCGAQVDRIKFHALTGHAVIGGKPCLLMKPNTYMNNSGVAVGECARFYQMPPERVLVLFDDIALEPGLLRIRRQGSAGGHNGIKSLIAHLGSEQFPRIKLGVGQKPHPEYDLARWVLSDVGQEELPLLRAAIKAACAATPLILQGDIEQAMNRYSR